LTFGIALFLHLRRNRTPVRGYDGEFEVDHALCFNDEIGDPSTFNLEFVDATYTVEGYGLTIETCDEGEFAIVRNAVGSDLWS
jgi:hypothetical protein